MGSAEVVLERRIEELEIRAAYQDDLLRQLDEVLRETADLARGLQVELERMRHEVQRIVDPAPNTLADEVPPHY